MSSKKISTPKGMRDFSPEEMVKREYIFDSIKSVFKSYGYQPLETPSMEYLSTLMGKYGEEGDKLLYKVLNSGNFLSNDILTELNDSDLEKKAIFLGNQICEKGLRYDLTVPFARYVVENQGKIQFPFKRYQIQPVWRADRPQKGRYREFYQCDADVVGSTSMLNEVELIQIIDDVFKRLEINIVIKINNRKILQGIAKRIDASDQFYNITAAIDKLDKIGIEKVLDELRARGIQDEKLKIISNILAIDGDFNERLSRIKDSLDGVDIAMEGITEVEKLIRYIGNNELNSVLELDLTLARGLNYYTGTIIEVKAKDIQIGSIGGGGRYDNLAGIFGLENVSGVGISFGADRIYDVLSQLQSFPAGLQSQTDILFVNFGEKEASFCLSVLKILREEGISAELYPDSVKMKKQLNYANNKGVRFVALVGEEEMQSNVVTLKDMQKGTQEKMGIAGIINFIKMKN